VYGVIAIGALLAAESGSHPTHAATVASAAIAAGLYWLAHAYASVLGRRLVTRGHLTTGELSGALLRESSILAGAALPVLPLLLAWAAGASQETAVTVAVWSAAAGVVTLELVAGIRSRATPRELAFQAAVGAAMGLALLMLKVVLH